MFFTSFLFTRKSVKRNQSNLTWLRIKARLGRKQVINDAAQDAVLGQVVVVDRLGPRALVCTT